MWRFRGRIFVPRWLEARPSMRRWSWGLWFQVWLPILATIILAFILRSMELNARKVELIRDTLTLPSTIERLTHIQILRAGRLLDPALADSLERTTRRQSGASLAFVATFDDSTLYPLEVVTHPDSLHLMLGAARSDYRARRFVLHLTGACTLQMKISPGECQGRRIMAVAWARSGDIALRRDKQYYEVGKFHLSWQTDGAAWNWTPQSDFISQRSSFPLSAMQGRVVRIGRTRSHMNATSY